MRNNCIARSVRGDLMNSVTFGRARFALLPVLAGAAMALAGNTFTPTQAFAADVVCAPVPSSTPLTGNTTCTGAGDQAIFLSQTATATLTLDGVTIAGPLAPLGASADVVNGTQNLTINAINGGSITATIADSIALGSQGTTGSSTISVGATALAATGAGDTAGIGVQTTTGAISITAAGTVIDAVALNAASTGIGIAAESTTGAIGITTTGAGSIGNFAGTTLDFGIDAFSTSGALTISNTSQIGSTSATAGSGVDVAGIRAATGGSAAISVTNSGAIVVDNAASFGNANNSGIFASGGTGTLSITNSGAVTGGDFGLNAFGSGNITVSNSGAVTGDIGVRALNGVGATSTITVLATTGSSISGTGNAGGGGDGIAALGGASTGLVTVGTSASRIAGNVSGNGGTTNVTAQGINARGTGNVSVFTGTGAISTTTNGSASWAIRATSDGAGSVVVDTQGALTGTGTQTGGILANTTSGAGTVTVTTTGAVSSPNGTAIDVRSVNGAASVSASGAVTGGVGVGNDGAINVTVTGTGSATVTTSGSGAVSASGTYANATSSGVGIGVSSGTGGLTVNAGANVTSTTSNAIRTVGTTGTNTINITSGTTKGLGTGAGFMGTTDNRATISVSSSTAGLTTINTSAGATITSNSATTIAQNGDLAIHGVGGNVVVNNAGTLRGRMDFRGVTGGVAKATINNTGTWHTTGVTTLSAGGDVINNSGLLSTSGVTELQFGPSGVPAYNVFNNLAAGTLQIGANAAGVSTLFVGSNGFNNSGAITLVDNETNDSLRSNATYLASGTPTLAIDANLGSGTQTSCTIGANTVSDCVSFAQFTGATTTVTVNDIGGVGALNFTGVAIAHSDVGSPNSAFALGGANSVTTTHGTAIQKGFVQYQLLPDTANNNFVLVGLPADSMFELASLPGGLQNIWHGSAEGWADRMAALQQSLASGSTGDGPVPAQGGALGGLNVWGKISYSDLAHSGGQSATILGAGFAYDTSYTQGTLGIQVGVDKVVSRDAGGALLVGGLVGYNNSIMRFDSDRTKATYRVFNFGAYASYVGTGGLTADLLVKDDMARIDLNVPTVSGLKDGDANSFGVKGTVGQRIETGMAGVFFQPQASFAYVRSTIKNITDPSATFDFADANSARGTIGVNVGANTVGTGGFTYRPLVFLGVGHEFEGKNDVTITSGTTAIDLRDKPISTFGIASVGLNVFKQGGMAAFVKGDRLFSNKTNGWQIQAGMRFTN